MKIRPYADSDYKYIQKLVEGFYNEAVRKWGFEINDERLQKIVEVLRPTSWMAEDDGRLVGLIAGQVVYQHLDTEPIWQEFMFFVEPQYRAIGVRLYKYAEAWCRDQGITKMVMVHLHNSKAEKMERFYDREGYEPMETHWIKELK